MTKRCVHCGVEYASKGLKFCSHSCRARAQFAAGASPLQRRENSGSEHGRWRGGRVVASDGYVWVWTAPKTYRSEHRMVMATLLGRELRPGENVHHKNGIKTDNRPDNLELWTRHQPAGQRADEVRHCPGCRCKES